MPRTRVFVTRQRGARGEWDDVHQYSEDQAAEAGCSVFGVLLVGDQLLVQYAQQETEDDGVPGEYRLVLSTYDSETQTTRERVLGTWRIHAEEPSHV